MKKIITVFVFTAILVSCNSVDKTKNKDLESSENETELIDSVSKEIKERLKINPNDAEAYYNRGIAKELIGDLNGACDDAKKSIKLGSTASIKWVAVNCN